jgi:rSAM/selenodomain-associated transferase 1
MGDQSANNESLLIIFYRNPVPGKVKTRLAASMGNARAFAIYLLLADYTRRVAESFPVHKVVFYSDFIDTKDAWSANVFQKQLQDGTDLGERMENAFQHGFAKGYKSVCIVGTDCLELSAEILHQGFRKLLTHDVVIGPAEDGGYYLLGMNRMHTILFKNKKWSSSSVCEETLHDTRLLGLSIWQLPRLKDVDEEKDLPEHFKV